MKVEVQQLRREFPEDSLDEKRSPVRPAGERITRTARDKAVRDAVARKDWDLLVELSAQPGGFQEARSVAWPFLLHVEDARDKLDREVKEEADNQDGQQSPSLAPSPAPSPAPHRDERQVSLDTNRAFVHYPVESQQRKDKRKKQLTDLILGVLNRRQQLSYFQGYHDILSTLQLTLHPSVETDPKTFHLLQECAVKISLHRARDAMGSGLEPLTGQLRILRRLLRIADPELAMLIEEASPLPYWAISPLMTLYTHDLPTLALAQRVMDWVLARPPDAVIYLVAAFTLERKKDVQRLIDEGDDGMMHSLLCSLPELEADELELSVDKDDIALLHLDVPVPVPMDSHTTSATSDTTEDHPPATPASATIESSLYSEQVPLEKSDSAHSSLPQNTGPDAEEHTLPRAPPSPASSLSSLPPQDPVVDERREPTVPLSQILQAADQLRTRYPIQHKALRLDATMGPKSMLRTWSRDPDEILGDDAAEEAVLATDLVVLPDLDDDVFEYPPPVEKPTDTRLAALPKLDMGLVVTIGIPMLGVMLAVASQSPTARAHAQQATSWAFEFILRKLRLGTLPGVNLYN